MRFDNFAGDGKSKTIMRGIAILGTSGLVTAIEAFKEMAAILWRNSTAVVFYQKNDVTGIALQ